MSTIESGLHLVALGCIGCIGCIGLHLRGTGGVGKVWDLSLVARMHTDYVGFLSLFRSAHHPPCESAALDLVRCMDRDQRAAEIISCVHWA